MSPTTITLYVVVLITCTVMLVHLQWNIMPSTNAPASVGPDRQQHHVGPRVNCAVAGDQPCFSTADCQSVCLPSATHDFKCIRGLCVPMAADESIDGREPCRARDGLIHLPGAGCVSVDPGVALGDGRNRMCAPAGPGAPPSADCRPINYTTQGFPDESYCTAIPPAGNSDTARGAYVDVPATETVRSYRALVSRGMADLVARASKPGLTFNNITATV